mgnify:CR=1 FL=1
MYDAGQTACAASAALPAPETMDMTSVWDLAGFKWRLVNVFRVADVNVGAYCYFSDFKDEMLTLNRRQLVLKYTNPGSLEVAPLKDIKLWIKSTKAVAEIQAANPGARRARLPTELIPFNLPRRPKTVPQKHTGPKNASCGICLVDTRAVLQGCYCCDLSVHRACATAKGQNHVLCLDAGDRWVCDDCYVEAYGGGND